MDVSLYGRVLRRFWPLLVGGFVVACVLAVFSVAKVSPSGISYRKPAVYGASAELFLTQKGFPWGRTAIPNAGPNSKTSPTNLSGLTDLYAQFANSIDVIAIMRSHGAPKTWKLIAAPILPMIQGAALPVLSLTGEADSPADAAKAAALGTRSFVEYVQQQQKAAAIPNSQRVKIQVLQPATALTAVAVTPHKKTLPIMVFLGVMAATIALAFILENRRPRSGAVATPMPTGEARVQIASARRTA
jgi:hypothetical protein